MTSPRMLRTATAAMLLASVTNAPAMQVPTPEIEAIEEIPVGDGSTAYVMRAPLADTGQIVGMAMACDLEAKVTVYFGAFPPARIPVQLGIRTPDGRVERFGPVVHHCGPRCGFHSPELTDPLEAGRFLDAALQNGALVSNGYNSFWNRADPERNRQMRAIMNACGA